jgi:hypothetical protein
MGTLKETAGRAARAPAAPLLEYANRRFEDLHGHLDNRMNEVQAQVEQSLALSRQSLTLTRQLKEELDSDVQVIAELTVTLQRFAERFGDRIDEMLAAIEGLLEQRTNAAKD